MLTVNTLIDFYFSADLNKKNIDSNALTLSKVMVLS